MKDSIIKETERVNPDTLALHFLVREPKTNATKNKAIILLHGVGSNESDLFSLANELPDDLFVIAPRGPFSLGAGRYAWYSVDFSTGKPVYNAQQEAFSRAAIKEFIEQVREKYNLSEVYLGGFSQGAIMSYSVGLTNPGQIQGVLALSGRLLEEVRPLITRSNEVQQLRVFIAHGVQDSTLGIHYAREAKSYLEHLEVHLDYHEYALGHQINGAVLEDIIMWLRGL